MKASCLFLAAAVLAACSNGNPESADAGDAGDGGGAVGSARVRGR